MTSGKSDLTKEWQIRPSIPWVGKNMPTPPLQRDKILHPWDNLLAVGSGREWDIAYEQSMTWKP